MDLQAKVNKSIDHGLAVASGLSAAFVGHLFSEIDVDGSGYIDVGELDRLGQARNLERLRNRQSNGSDSPAGAGRDVDGEPEAGRDERV